MVSKSIYTSGDWAVKEGQEEEFIKRWSDFAHWSSENIPGSGDFYLIQDKANPRHFLSFGSWENPDAVADWRGRPEFKQFMGQNKEVCDEFKAGNYTLRVSSQQ
jgi:heme-degrading monooxygenase HmoA